MCTTSFVIMRNAHNEARIRTLLRKFCSSVDCGVNFDSADTLLELPFVTIGDTDVAFEIYDNHFVKDAGIFMSLETPFKADTKPRIPLHSCFSILQQAIMICLPYAQFAEIYLTNSHASAEDFTDVSIPAEKLRMLLQTEYDKEPQWSPFVPDLHIFVVRDAKDSFEPSKSGDTGDGMRY